LLYLYIISARANLPYIYYKFLHIKMKYFRFIRQIPTLWIQFESRSDFQSFTLDIYESIYSSK